MRFLFFLLALQSHPLIGHAGFFDKLTGSDEIAPEGSHYFASVERYFKTRKPEVTIKCAIYKGSILDGMEGTLTYHYKQGRVDSKSSPTYYFHAFGITNVQDGNTARALSGTSPFIFVSVFAKSKRICEALVDAHTRPDEEMNQK